MYFFSILLTTASLLVIIYQDSVSRSVHWICFPVLAIGGALLSFSSRISASGFLQHFLFNLCFLCIQWLLLKLWFFFRYRYRSIVDKMIGMGDLIFLGVSAVFFSPMNFIAFYLGSLVFVLLVRMAAGWLHVLRNSLIPLAGLQAITLLIVIYTNWFMGCSLQSDQWWIEKMIAV